MCTIINDREIQILVVAFDLNAIRNKVHQVISKKCIIFVLQRPRPHRTHNSVPIFNQTIPSSCHQFAWFMWMPERGYTDTFMRLPLLVELCRFPVPNVRFSITVTGNQITVNSENNYFKPSKNLIYIISNSPHVW